MRLFQEIPLAPGARPYHIGEQKNEVVADSAGEWFDIEELIFSGALINASAQEDRHSLVFPSPQAAKDALDELRLNKVLA